MKDISIYIDNVSVDLYQDVDITLNFENTVLSDISKIKSDYSQTIKLPKTATNDLVFQLALTPNYNSGKRGSSMLCRVVIEGLAIIDEGLCHLLDSSGDSYEICITWGNVGAFERWIANKPKLRDMPPNGDNDYISWDERNGEEVREGGASILDTYDEPWSEFKVLDNGYGVLGSLMYGAYNPMKAGYTLDKSKCNISPYTPLKEIYDRIRLYNGLKFSIDRSIKESMKDIAVVLTENNNTSLTTKTINTTFRRKALTMRDDNKYGYKRLYFNVNNVDIYDTASGVFLQYGYRDVSISFSDIYISMSTGLNNSLTGASDFASNASMFSLVIKTTSGVKNYQLSKVEGIFNTIKASINETFSTDYVVGSDRTPILEIYLKLKKWDTLPQDVWDSPNYAMDYIGQVGGWEASSLTGAFRIAMGNTDEAALNGFIYTYQENSHDYPLERFELTPNLPDIGQVDFVKFLCQFYGVFPRKNGDVVEFVSIDIFYRNLENRMFVDWSEKHIITNDDAPKSIAFSVGDYAQRNIVRYELDDADAVDDSFIISVDNMTLANEKELITFPFSASKGNRISQYWYDDDGNVQIENAGFRIMNISYNDNEDFLPELSYGSNLSAEYVVKTRYREFIETIRRPIVISEMFNLTIVDLFYLDMTKPVYLSKYGRYYIILSIRWNTSDKLSEVKLLQM